MKLTIVFIAIAFLTSSQGFGFDLTCDQGRIAIESQGGVNYLNGSPMKKFGNFLVGAPGKFMVWAGLNSQAVATLWIYSDKNSDFVSNIVDCEAR